MGEIKSALELALERTASIPSDREALRRHEAQNDGKRIFARVRDGEDVNVAAELANHPAEARAWVRQGLFEVARSNMTFPKTESDIEQLDLVETVLAQIAKDKKLLTELMGQVRQFFSQYLADRQQLIEQLRKQFEPRIREREKQLAQQYGRAVRLDPASDPEFSKVLQDQIGRLDGQYRGAFAQVDEHLSQIVG